jgi:hypothetical protein
VTTGLAASPCTIPSGLSPATNYWVTVVDANTIRLRSTEAAGQAVNITGAGVGTCHVLPNKPIYTANFRSITGATVNVATNLVTMVSHGYTTGVRGRLTALGGLLGAQTGVDYYVTAIDADTFYLSKDGPGITPIDFGISNGREFIDSEAILSTDRFYIQDHSLTNGTAVQFSSTKTLPSPLDNVTTYYVVGADSNSFQVSTVVAGAAVDLTSYNPTAPLDPDPSRHKITPTAPGAGPIDFAPNYPDMQKQDYQVIGNESWYSPVVSLEVE